MRRREEKGACGRPRAVVVDISATPSTHAGPAAPVATALGEEEENTGRRKKLKKSDDEVKVMKKNLFLTWAHLGLVDEPATKNTPRKSAAKLPEVLSYLGATASLARYAEILKQRELCVQLEEGVDHAPQRSQPSCPPQQHKAHCP